MKTYLQQRFLRNNHPRYHKYMNEWIDGVTADQMRHFREERRRIEQKTISS